MGVKLLVRVSNAEKESYLKASISEKSLSEWVRIQLNAAVVKELPASKELF